jgi:predicted nucleic acid-binding protein
VRLILDADLLIGALDGADPHHSDARELFVAAQKQDARRLISVVNLSEVLVAPAADAERLRLAREAIAALGVEIHGPGLAVGLEAARLRGRHPISLADAYCLATAKQTKGSVASFDRKVLRAAEDEGITLAVTGSTERPPL